MVQRREWSQTFDSHLDVPIDDARLRILVAAMNDAVRNQRDLPKRLFARKRMQSRAWTCAVVGIVRVRESIQRWFPRKRR